MEHPLHLETLCVQAREDVPSDVRPLVAPIYQTAVWAMESAEQCEAIYAGEVPGYIYTRDGNPNHVALERIFARLEGAEEAVVFGSGMGAIAGALTALTGSGGRVVAAKQLYGATVKLLNDELSRFGVETVWVDMLDLAAVEQALTGGSVLLVETIANPLVQVADLPAMAALCRASGSKLVVDNTFAPPPCCQPLEQGADLVIHSVTKFLGGHSDLTLGAVAGSKELMQRVRWQAKLFGGSANPFECWLAVRGIATYTLRIERSCANAQALAERLAAHPKVRRVYYPGLPSHPQFAQAQALLGSPGAMLAFDAEDARGVLRSLKHVRFAPSLGDVSTTISYPAITSHRALTAEQRAEIGISDGTLRLSVGIDHVEDVWGDLAQALEG